MSVSYIIAHENGEAMNTEYFVEQLKKKWPEVKIHFNADKSGNLLQFSTPDDISVLGDFSVTGVWYHASSSFDIVQFALWYRSIVPPEWKLRFYDSGLYFDMISITPETTEEQIIAGFDVPFDISKYE